MKVDCYLAYECGFKEAAHGSGFRPFGDPDRDMAYIAGYKARNFRDGWNSFVATYPELGQAIRD